jgi:hypothetical protein
MFPETKVVLCYIRDCLSVQSLGENSSSKLHNLGCRELGSSEGPLGMRWGWEGRGKSKAVEDQLHPQQLPISLLYSDPK